MSSSMRDAMVFNMSTINLETLFFQPGRREPRIDSGINRQYGPELPTSDSDFRSQDLLTCERVMPV